MKILMLGTGAADGWPTPFCTCASCLTEAAAGRIRRQTSALIDDAVLMDCGAETARSAVHAGHRLDAVKLVLFTHAHPDHCDAQALLWRSWAGITERLVVAGPPDAIERCRMWVGPQDPVDLVELVPGSTLDVAGYRVVSVAATHTPGALLYDLTAPDGSTLLYATDTGPLSTATLDALTGRRFDAALIEETWGEVTDHGTLHLDLATFADTVRCLRDVEALDTSTDVVAIHLGHRNPPEPELLRRLAAWGARAVRDHDEIFVGSDATADGERERPQRPRRTLVLGGARSGKSTEAESLVASDAQVIYVATSVAPSVAGGRDPEWDERVRLHQQRRPAHWRTVETADVSTVLRSATPDTTLLVDCLTLWLTAHLDALAAWEATDAALRLEPVLADLIHALRTTTASVVMVSNEVGSGIVPDTPAGRLFRDLMGRVNARVASECEQVLLVTAGRAQVL